MLLFLGFNTSARYATIIGKKIFFVTIFESDIKERNSFFSFSNFTAYLMAASECLTYLTLSTIDIC